MTTASDRDRIRDAALDRGWEEELSPPHSVTFYKASRSVHVIFSRDGSTPVDAFHGMKKIRGRDLTQQVIDTLKED